MTMKLPTVKRCCCLDLRNAGLAIGVMSNFISVLWIGLRNGNSALSSPEAKLEVVPHCKLQQVVEMLKNATENNIFAFNFIFKYSI